MMSAKFPAQVMVLRDISNESDFQPVWEKDVWPSVSPNRNPLAYFACGVTESKARTDPEDQGGDEGPSTGAPWRSPAAASSSRSRLSSLLTEISLNKSILKMFLCQLFFISIKSDDSQMCSVIFKTGV